MAVISVKMVSKVFVNERLREFKLLLPTMMWQANELRDDELWQGTELYLESQQIKNNAD